MTAAPAILDVQSLSITFAGLRALSDVSFHVAPGCVFGLIGPNGAGKTTLLNCLSRVYTPDAGRILFAGEDILARPIHRLASLGIARTFQNLELAREATLLENVLVGCLHRHRASLVADLFNLPAARRAAAAARADALALIDEFGLAADVARPVSVLPLGVQKRVELARALAQQPRLLMLDEPAAGLNPEETAELARVIRGLRDRRGITVILIEHDMRLVMGVCDRILVLDHGEMICEDTPEKVRANPEVIRAYLGEEGVDAA